MIGEANAQGKIVAIDPSPNNPCQWSGATVLKPNRREAFLAAGLPYVHDEESILNAAAALQKKHAVLYLLITLGEVDLLVILLPLSLLLAFAIGCSGHNKNQADGRHQKGVA